MKTGSPILAAAIAAQIRMRRQSLGVRQKDLAELAEISIHTLSNIESGKGNPSLDVLGRLLGCLGLKLTIEPHAQRHNPTLTAATPDLTQNP